MPNIIPQGTDCWIQATGIYDVRTGEPINVTGYSVYAVARARFSRRVLGRPSMGYRYRMWNPVVASWSTTPTGTEGVATAGGDSGANQVQLHVTPAQTAAWRCPLVAIQADLTDPVTQYVARIIDEVYEVSFDDTSMFDYPPQQ